MNLPEISNFIVENPNLIKISGFAPGRYVRIIITDEGKDYSLVCTGRCSKFKKNH